MILFKIKSITIIKKNKEYYFILNLKIIYSNLLYFKKMSFDVSALGEIDIWIMKYLYINVRFLCF
jgi:hypothetical protein